MSRSILTALVCSTLLACGPDLQLATHTDALKARPPEGGGKKSRTPAPTTFTARTTDGRAEGVEPVWQNAFAIDTTYDVHLAAEITGSFGGHHTASFELRMPNGTVYQRVEVPFATDAVAYPGEQQAEAFSGGWRVWTKLPVAGTLIQQYALTGVWRLEIFVDGAAAPTASASFDLQ